MSCPIQKIGLRHRITVLCIVIAVTVMLLIGFSLYRVVPSMLLENASEISRGNLETVAAGLEQRLQSVVTFAGTFASNAEISSALTRHGAAYVYSDATLLSTVFRLITVSNENLIDSIVISTDRGKLYVGGNGGYLSPHLIQERFAALEGDLTRTNWVLRHEGAPMRNYASMKDVPDVVSLYYTLYDTVSLNRIGVMYIALDPDVLLSAQQETDRTVFLADEQGRIVSGSRDASLSPALFEQLSLQQDQSAGSFVYRDGEETWFAVYTQAADPGWHLVELIPYRSLVGDARRFILFLSYILAASFAAILLLTGYGTRRSLAPLRRLRDSMLAVQEGNYDIRVRVETRDEIGQLAGTYDLMLSRIKQLISEIRVKEEQKSEIEMQVLQMQINPHFLYNTLNSIHWMAVMHGLDSISNMVEALVAILRHSLKDFRKLTTLQEEIETLKQYLFIQNVRFNNGITIACSLPEELKEARIPRLLLQPLVENAVLHGIRPRGGKGAIRVDCRGEGENVVIDVADDGVGFAESIPEFVSFSDLETALPASGKSFSIGLKNTHERIRLHFGAAFGLWIRSEKGGGTQVRILLPRVTEPEGGADDVQRPAG